MTAGDVPANAAARPFHPPRATYRVQLHKDFPLAAATRLVPYLHALGISHLYVSPLLKARPGSTHGYDVIDYSSLNPELGELSDLEGLARALHQRGMGLIVDVVPNHMGILADDNPWWLDVLENGPAARYAPFLDVDWHPRRASLRERLLVPVLGGPLGVVLEKGELEVEFEPELGSFTLRYFEHRFPLDPREYPLIFPDVAASGSAAEGDVDRADFESLLAAFARLPGRSENSEAAQAERYRDKEAHKRRLARLYQRSESIANFVTEAVRRINGTPGEPRSFEPLARLLEAQAYRLAFWRVAGDEINYRRFFDVNQLAALRMEREEVFDATHALILDWVKRGWIDGLRIDHPDGLHDPANYFARLQRHCGATAEHPAPIYMVAEKILADHEHLPAQWPIHGSTGYEFAALVSAWLVDGEHEDDLTRLYRAYTGEQRDFSRIAEESRRQIMRTTLAAEVALLASQLDRLAQLDRRTADFTWTALRDAIVETIAVFPVYRTYVSPNGVGEEDRRFILWAINVARRHSRDIEASVFDFLGEVLLGETLAHQQAALAFAMKFQQVTAPVMAKGVEDTALYRYYRLASLNEVGGDPRRFGASSAALHHANAERARWWPHAMLGTSTHDTKRSEDVRARIAVLSEMPEAWRTHLARWRRLNRAKRSVVDEQPAPSRNDEYLLYQALLGAWPAGEETADTEEFRRRICDYAVKAARESKSNTSWINVSPEYEQALRKFVERLLSPSPLNAFRRDLLALLEPVREFGMLNSLSQTLLKLTSPGVPDLYQGSELFTDSLVDPDNRRPVDYEKRTHMLAELAREANEKPPRELLNELLGNWQDGRIKLFVTWRLLQLRARMPLLFSSGSYEPLRIAGAGADRLVAFARRHEGKTLVVAATRWHAKPHGGKRHELEGVAWQDTQIEVPAGMAAETFAELFSSRLLHASQQKDVATLSAASLLSMFPIAALTASSSASSAS